MAFGFDKERRIEYGEYIGVDAVRIDVAGGIRGIGVIKNIELCQRGEKFVLSPYLFVGIKKSEVSKHDKGQTIITNGSPLSIIPLNRTLEAYVDEINNDAKEDSKK